VNHTKESIENKENLFREPSAGRTIDYDYDYEHEHDARRTNTTLVLWTANHTRRCRFIISMTGRSRRRMPLFLRSIWRQRDLTHDRTKTFS